MMTTELARARQAELLANARKIETMVALEQVTRLERFQRSVRVASARLGLIPAKAS
jgi:hypothetical protein